MENNILSDVINIILEFQRIIEDDKSLDKTYFRNKSEIEEKYKAKINDLDSKRKHRIANADTQNKDTMDKIQECLNDLSFAENRIPAKYLKKYNKKSLSPEIPDLDELYDLSIKINDWSVSGVFKRFTGIGGYSSIEDMVNKYIDSIESARLFLNDAIQTANDIFIQEKTNAESEFRQEKKLADQKRADLYRQVDLIYSQSQTSLHNRLQTLINDPSLVLFDKKIGVLLETLGAFDDSWDTFTPCISYPEQLLIGAITIPVTIPSPVDQLVKGKMPISFSSGKNMFIPMTVSTSQPIQLVINYDELSKTTVMEGVQSILLKYIRSMPLYSFCITYIDPIDRGTNLGKLQKLEEITSWDICKKVYTSREDIAKRLKELEKYVDETCSRLAGIDSVYIYNQNNEVPIIQNLLVINDFPEKLDRASEESLNVLINNAEKCGISMIFTKKDNISELPDVIQNSFTRINASINGNSIFTDGKLYDFQFDNVCANCDGFINKVKSAYEEGLHVNNSFANYFSLSKFTGYKESTKSLQIPFAIDSKKKLVELELGGALSAHALLSGATGSGKSTTLHMLITSIILNYHPDDVELWLVDYNKVEFAEYISNNTPSIKLIGLERGSEFTFSLLDKINDECLHRMDLFKQVGVSDITEYKRKFGVRSLPRIILIIDEFHQMTQAIQNTSEYVLILENVLSEYRKFGLSCIFSDQAISEGLRGLTDKGKKQIRSRLAMSNDPSEIRDTLAIDYSFYDESLKNKINRMDVGDVVFKRGIKDSTGETQIIIDKYRTIYVSREERIKSIAFAQRNLGSYNKTKDILVIDGKERKNCDQNVIEKFEVQHGGPKESFIPIYVGTPANLSPCFRFILENKPDSNIMVIGSNTEMRASIVLFTISCFARLTNYEIFIIADKNDELFKNFQDDFKELSCDRIHIITKTEEICSCVDGLLEDAKKELQPETLLVWLGIEAIGEYLSMLPQKMNSKEISEKEEVDNLVNDIDSMIAAFEQKNNSQKTSVSAKSSAYDAREDISELIAKGTRFGIHNFVTYSSTKMLRQARFVKSEYFEHKIAFSMSRDDWSNYIERIPYIADLDKISAVYYDGGSAVHIFRPYLFQ